MSVRTQRLTRPETSSGPFRFFEAVPWLLLAEAFRFAGASARPLLTFLALILECVAVLMAFNAVARRAFPLFALPVPLEGLSIGDEIRLSLRIFWRVAVVIIVATVLATCAGLEDDAPYFVWGLTCMAFNQLSYIGRMWAAVIAVLVLAMLLEAGRTGTPTLKSAIRRLGEHGIRFGAHIAALAIFYVGWGTIQYPAVQCNLAHPRPRRRRPAHERSDLLCRHLRFRIRALVGDLADPDVGPETARCGDPSFVRLM